jgi:hypothetical protein
MTAQASRARVMMVDTGELVVAMASALVMM